VRIKNIFHWWARSNFSTAPIGARKVTFVVIDIGAKMKRIFQGYLEVEQINRLAAIASERKVSSAFLVRQAIDAMFPAAPQSVTAKKPRKS
jgi:hypothetical protein